MTVRDYIPILTYLCAQLSLNILADNNVNEDTYNIILYTYNEDIIICMYKISFINHYIVPTSQSEVTVMQSDDNQPRQDDASSQRKHANGLYECGILCVV